MRIWLVYKLEDEHLLDEKMSAVNTELINAKLDTYKGSPENYTAKRYHPTKDLVAASFKIHKTSEWTLYILKHINEDDLIELSEDWEPKLS